MLFYLRVFNNSESELKIQIFSYVEYRFTITFIIGYQKFTQDVVSYLVTRKTNALNMYRLHRCVCVCLKKTKYIYGFDITHQGDILIKESCE